MAGLLAVLFSTGGCIAMSYDPSLFAQVAQIQQDTPQFHTLASADAAGYAQFLDCVSEDHGAMGVHFVNGDLVGDTVLDPLKPEALLYEPGAEGMQLTGVEYIVFEEAWRAEHSEPPSLFGHEFTYVASPNRYDLPPFYALHAWVWKLNPQGLFADWSTMVSCANAEQTAHTQ
jgi:hypothetical protein